MRFPSRICFLIVFFVIFASGDGRLSKQSDPNNKKTGKFLSLFQVVEFPNDPCTGSGSKNGTCYTSNECEAKGGTSSGTCASSYGVCCTFTLRCGMQTSENCTYFESQGTESGSCRATVCPVNSNICQMRLDFVSFSLNGPDAGVTSTVRILNGSPAVSANAPQARPATQCNTDSFNVISSNGRSPAPICGMNTNEHLYVDASQSCNQLSFSLGDGATLTRSWNIKVTQYSCDFPNLAPDGCDQWFFGSTTGSVRTFNYDSGNGYHLAFQDQNICVRRELGSCKICWAAENAIDFMLSGPDALAKGYTTSQCCGYGTNGKGVNGFDCVMIPSAEKTDGVLLAANAFCGRSAGLVKSNGLVANMITVCSRRAPFQLRFTSDGFEFLAELTTPDRGFELDYTLSNC